MQLWSIFIASILGSTHCAAMCGGLASYCSSFCNKRFNINYHLGRLSSYLVLGAGAGLIGTSIDKYSKLQGLISLITGCFLIIWGILFLIGKSEFVKSKLGSRFFTTKLSKTFSMLIANFIGNDPKLWQRRSFLVGFFSAFMPCGWLYAFVLVSAAAGSVLQSIAIMFVFWLGTLPALIFVGEFSKKISFSLRKFSPTLVAIILIIAGLYSIGVRDPISKLSGNKTEMKCH